MSAPGNDHTIKTANGLPERPFHRSGNRRSSVGPGAVGRCLANAIARIECDVLLSQPGDPSKHGDSPSPETLLPSATRTLCLSKDEESDEYNLTVIKKEKNDVFLNLPLSGLLDGTISYDLNKQWHEVTVNNPHHPQRFVFLLKSNTPDSSEVKEFNKKLNAVFEEILKSASLDLEKEVDAERESVSASVIVTPVRMATAKAQGPVVAGEAPRGDVSAGRSSNRPQMALPAQTVEQMVVALAAAIEAGNVKKAQELSTILAQSHTRVDINYDAASEERKAREQEISVTVHVEDRESTGLTLSDIKVRPHDTILDLKRSFLGKYGFPVEVQKWIIGRRICGDDESLSKCEVNTSGHTLYLYLLNARAVNISRDDDRRTRQSQASPGAGNMASVPSQRSGQGSEYETMNMPFVSVGTPPARGGQAINASNTDLSPASQLVQGPPAGAGSAMRQQSQLSTASSSNSLAASSFGLSDTRGNLEPGSGPVSGQRGLDSRPRGGSMVGAVGRTGQAVMTAGGGAVSDRPLLQGSPVDMVLAHEEESDPQGWQCKQCTLINQPTRPGCEACGFPRPTEYKVPSTFVVSKEEQRRLEHEREMEAIMKAEELHSRECNYQQLLQADSNDLVANTSTFTCPICFDDIESGQGVVLRECLHQFCRSCLTDTVRLTEEAELKCPFQDDSYRCDAMLQDREVRALVSEQVYEQHLRRSLDLAESQASNSYHCKTPDCQGWCLYEDLVNFFKCPVCRHENCLTCRAIHESMNCKQYQEDLRIRAANDKAAQQTQVMLQEMLEKGEAMPCPQCEVIVQKKDGCDWIRCSICKTEICWVTKGRRWGPKGEGDTTGGCKCRVGGRRCHPKCNNCH